ncbi:hypothetical protein I4U23_027248 [Adineta vaga]|nr:hypothetical protein I4U23_027248 [Adineta vaga]
MLLSLFVFLLFIQTGYTIKCIVGCSIHRPFHTTFSIPDDQCEERSYSSSCSVSIEFRYDQKSYTVSLSNSEVSFDYIYITSGSYLTYEVNYKCSKDTDCPVAYAKNRVKEMVARQYNAEHIHNELVQYIGNSVQNDSIQCYDSKQNVILCAVNDVCSVEFNTESKKVSSRGCDGSIGLGSRIYWFDDDISPSLRIKCNKNLCNSDEVLNQVKRIFYENGLTDANARRIAAGMKKMTSVLLITLAIICSMNFSF